MLIYKGYSGYFQRNAETGVIFGRVLGIQDVVTFKSATATEVVQAFKDSVDDYLEFCRARGEKPNKP